MYNQVSLEKKLGNVLQNHDLDFDDVLQLPHQNLIAHILRSIAPIFLYLWLICKIQITRNWLHISFSPN